MPTTITSTIAAYTDGDYLDEVMVNFKTELMKRRGTNGQTKKIKDYDPTNEFAIKGGGNPAIPVGVASLTITGLTGGLKMIPSFQHTEHNTEFDDFDLKGEHYPNGSAG